LQSSPIGLFDSGIGGLSILREVQRQLPAESIIYLADQAHVPYGQRTLEEVRQLSFAIVEFLLEQGAKLITVACNTASAASLHALREQYPRIPFVGMEPAVKPAAEKTRSHTVGVLATPATFQGALFTSVVERFAKGVNVLQETLPGMVELIEKGEIESAETHRALEQGVRPLLEQGADTLVLACTHFPFIIPQLKKIVGEKVKVIDPSPAVARQIDRLLSQADLLSKGTASLRIRYVTTGDPAHFAATLDRLGFEEGEVFEAIWETGKLQLSTNKSSIVF
jgi:glutamate racemase